MCGLYINTGIMQKLKRSFALLCLLGGIFTALAQTADAGWYGDHAVSFLSVNGSVCDNGGGSTACNTECDDDGDVIGGTGDTVNNKDHRVLMGS